MNNFEMRTPEDLARTINTLLLNDKDMRMLSFVNFLPSGLSVGNTKIEWLDDEARPIAIDLTASGSGADWDNVADITALPVPAATIGQLRVGDVLVLGTDEMVVVKAIDATSVDLYSRGHGTSTAAVQGTAEFTAKIVGNAQIEDGNPISDNFVDPTEQYNYTQIFEDVVKVSGSLRRSKNVSGDEHQRQVIKKLKELLVSLNYTLAEGLRNIDTTNKIRTMGGLRELLTTTYNVGGAITLPHLYSIMEAGLNAGSTITQLHASVNSVSAINQLFTGETRYETSQNRVGLNVKKIEIMGLSVELYPDRHVRDGEVIAIDNDRVKYGFLSGGAENGAFKSYPLLDQRNGKQYATQLLGEYTLKVMNGAGAGVRAYGIA